MPKKLKADGPTDRPTNRQAERVIESCLHDYKKKQKTGYTATLVACGWAGAIIVKVSQANGQGK